MVADLNSKSVEQTLQDIHSGSTQNHTGIVLDVGEKISIYNAFNQVLEKYKKPPTVIVNSAGITRDNFLLKLSEQDFDEVLNVNLKVCLFLTLPFYIRKKFMFHSLSHNI